MNLSKSKYCNGIQCKKILWLDKYKSEEREEDNNSVLEQGNLVHEVARYMYPNHITIPFNLDLSEMIKDTYSSLESYKDIVICEASFKYMNNFCSVDILKKDNDDYEMYEVKSSTGVRDVYINDISYQYYVLNNLGFKIKKCYLVYLNNKYVRCDHIDLNELFICEDVTDKIKSMQDEVKNNLDDINKYMDSNVNEPIDDIDIKCFKPYPCPYFKYCKRNLPDKNVFDIAGMHKDSMIKLYKNGIYKYDDLLNSDILEFYKMQILYDMNDMGDYIDKEKIKDFLDTLSYPLYYLDFETYQMPIPLYDNVSPYEQVPFQYSLHYLLKEEGKLYHSEFLANSGSDPRRCLAERLVKDIPMDVCTIAYNMKFEKSVIKRLAMLYPDLSNHLMNIHDNMKDLMIPFKKRYYYNKKMEGSYSIKYVLPALFPNDPELDYHNLDLIHNGSEAMNSFRDMEGMDKETLEYTRERLLEYCKLDTYAMVKIHKKLIDIVR